MEKIQFVFIILLVFVFTGCKSNVKKPVVEQAEAVEEKTEGVLFQRLVDGKFGWYENGDEAQDGKYVVQIKKVMPHGQGTVTFPEGDNYEGDWENGEKHGQGTYIFQDGDKYVGEWNNGKKHGQGTYTYDDGAEYVGEYNYGKEDGNFCLILN